MSNSRRSPGEGGIRKRGDSWTLRFSATDPRTGKTVRRYATVKGGSKTAAMAKLRELAKGASEGAFVATPRQTVGDAIDTWLATLSVSPKTAERYREIVELHVRPHLGVLKLQGLRTSRIEAFYTDLHAGRGPGGEQRKPLAARTISHVHRRVVAILSIAERDGHIPSNPARKANRPKAERAQIEILDAAQVREVLDNLGGHTHMRRLAALGLATGMRRGELCAVRWKDVDLDRVRLRIERSLEQTKGKERGAPPVLRFKVPKTRNSQRTISLPASIVGELRAHRREQAEERLRLGLGRDPDDGLVFRRMDPKTGEFGPLVPNSVTTEWRRLVKSLGLPAVSLHAWRHPHASQLIDSGMDVLTISRRLGHSSPSITLDVYGHLFSRKDEGAADVFEAAFGGAFTGTDADETRPAATADGVRLVSNPIPLHQGARSST
jgi:integrase